MEGQTTRITQYIAAPPARVYAALIDAEAVMRWRVPEGMTSRVHHFEPWEGGRIRVSLTYEEATAQGKSEAHTDTYHGRFVTLVPNEMVVEVDEFETADPALQGEMTITIRLREVAGRTELTAEHAGLPRGVAAGDNEVGWRMALAKLAALVEQG